MADEIIATSGGSYTPAPEGEFKSLCVDVIDLGLVENKTYGGMRHKAALVFQLEEVDTDTGKRFEVAERFTVSMHEKARLRQFLGQWRGKSYTDAEAKQGTPLHKLEGQPAVIQVEHHQAANGRVYANIFTIRRLGKGETPLTANGYVRSEGWKKAQQPAEQAASSGGHPDDDPEESSVPF